jgi:RNA-directed DNA polymerase
MRVATRPDVVSEAISRVKANRGAPGIDGMTVEELDAFWRKHGARICQVLRAGEYVPRPVRRVTIPKPGGGERLLGIPTVVDRVVQQMLLTVLEPIFEPTFSDASYGFRPGRTPHEAVLKAREYVSSGLEWVVDIDLEKFFDRVNHDVLMSRLARRIADKRMLKLLRRYLETGVMVNGVVMEVEEGTPQGGPLSPLLANVLLDDLDKELERRGHRFVRYADDCNIYVGSEAAARRVMESATRFLEAKLRLRVNRAKSAAAKTPERRFLGFTLDWKIRGRWVKIRISEKALARFKDAIRARTPRVRRVPARDFFRELDRYTAGWAGYYARFEDSRAQLADLDSWIRRRIRQWLWVQWKTPGNRRKNLLRGGVWKSKVNPAVWTRSAWKAAGGQALSYCVNNQRIREGGLIPLLEHWQRFASS